MTMTEEVNIVVRANMQTKEDRSLEQLSLCSSCNFVIRVCTAYGEQSYSSPPQIFFPTISYLSIAT